MKTHEIMNVFEYSALGGPIEAIPVVDVRCFLHRILNRLADIQNEIATESLANAVQSLQNEVDETMRRL